jgi:hypothetical protein
MRSAFKGSLIGAVVAVIALVLIGPASAAASVTVTPDSGLVDGQQVNVAGSGFNAGDTIVIHECIHVGTDPLACDYRKLATANSSGTFSSIKFTVHPVVGGQTCVESDPCFIRVKDAHSNVVRKPIHFGSTATSTTLVGTTSTTHRTTTTTHPTTTTTHPTTTTTTPSPCANPTIVGTNAGEALQGTAGNDIINGRGGADFIDGKGGNDTICGGDGDDVIQGGDGNDKLFGNEGNDTLDGQDGTDACNGGGGSSDFGAHCESQSNIP